MNKLTLATVNQYVRIVPASECSLIMYIDQPLNDTLATQLKNIAAKIVEISVANTIEIITSYASLLVSYNPMITDHFAVKSTINKAIKLVLESMAVITSAQEQVVNVVELPVYYSEQSGPDLQRIAQHHNLTVEDVIRIHQQETYRVFAIGFAPGFGYLGQVNEQIAMPRLSTPRSQVPKGAVAIADRQTAVYPAASPGGWNIIGQCPILMFNPNPAPAPSLIKDKDKDENPTMPFKVGDSVRFYAIDKQEYLALDGQL